MKLKITLMAILLGATSAQAEFKDGNKLLSQMQGTHSEQMVAMGYITGVADTLHGVVACPPTNVTAGQLNDMVLKYLENFPQTRSFSGDVIVQRVLVTVWPCKKGSSL